MPAAAQLLLSALSKQVPGPAGPAPLTSELPRTVVSRPISGPPLTEAALLTGAAFAADLAPLTSEPPLADATPLTSEPPLAVAAPLTSEPAAPGAAGGMESPGV
ncbi:hypothetical protein [uncultured Streptomyces sp.]|uniref:hypothetical protein n=1 Tax=uncultured Streptomyces sp. TaxID=174707 RepID=UPI00262F0F9F|nr:hypothetical protein [uncultured Streptomyces sp.]